MAQISETVDATVKNLDDYALVKKQVEEERMNVVPSDRAIKDFETRLQATVEDLRQHVARQRAELDELRRQSGSTFSAIPSTDPQTRLRQLQIIDRAYDNLSNSPPTLPSTNSLLPSLLAARTIQRTIAETTQQIEEVTDARDYATSQSSKLDAQAADAETLGQKLRQRIQSLKTQGEERHSISPEEQLRRALAEKQRRRRTQQLELKETEDALASFINQYLASMIAAEELGGPVTGDGDLPTSKATPTTSEPESADPKRQKRIDEIWGQRSTTTATTASPSKMKPEVLAAANEIRSLLDQLLKAQRSGGEVFVQLERDSAAARFLVRAKVAVYHPRDARRLRIVDFARGWED